MRFSRPNLTKRLCVFTWMMRERYEHDSRLRETFLLRGETGGVDQSLPPPQLRALFCRRALIVAFRDTDKFSRLINENERYTVWKARRRRFVLLFAGNEIEPVTLWGSEGESGATVNQRWRGAASWMSSLYGPHTVCKRRKSIVCVEVMTASHLFRFWWATLKTTNAKKQRRCKYASPPTPRNQ